MIKSIDLSNFNWVQNSLAKPGTAQTLSYYIPSSFDAYCKIFHSIYEDPNHIDLKKSHEDLLQEHLKTSKNIIPSSIFQKEFDLNYSRKVTWQELAQRYNFPFNDELSGSKLIKYISDPDENNSCPAYLKGPNLGKLDFTELSNLSKYIECDSVLSYYGILTDVEKGERIYECHLNQLNNLLQGNNNWSPTYWWNDKRDWIVWTDYDQCYSIVGGSEELITNICKDKNLEVLKTTLNKSVN